MSTTQQERRQAANSHRGVARGQGYLHGLYGVESSRMMLHPDHRFAYDMGYHDGAKAREAALAGRSE